MINFILACYGLTMIVVYGSIFESFRKQTDKLGLYGKLFRCPMCFGFWSGVFFFSINKFTELFSFDYNLSNAFIAGCISSGTSYLIAVMVDDFGIKIYSKGEKNAN